MNIEEFQKKLTQVQKMAVSGGKQIEAKEVEAFFGNDGLSGEQLTKVFAYLRLQGILVKGVEVQDEESPIEAAKTVQKAEVAPLTREELEYLIDYEKSIQELAPEMEKERDALLEMAAKKEEWAKKRLAELYMREVVDTAKSLHQEGQFIGDMIAEGNMGLIMAIDKLDQVEEDRQGYLCREIEKSISGMLEEQYQQTEEDHILVSRVENLEKRMKELLEDEESKYSVEELSIFLDMDVEEIRSVLRLTGEDQ